MGDVVGRVEVNAIPATTISSATDCPVFLIAYTHVGKRRLTMMPAGHGLVGKAFVSGKRVFISCRQV